MRARLITTATVIACITGLATVWHWMTSSDDTTVRRSLVVPDIATAPVSSRIPALDNSSGGRPVGTSGGPAVQRLRETLGDSADESGMPPAPTGTLYPTAQPDADARRYPYLEDDSGLAEEINNAPTRSSPTTMTEENRMLLMQLGVELEQDGIVDHSIAYFDWHPLRDDRQLAEKGTLQRDRRGSPPPDTDP